MGGALSKQGGKERHIQDFGGNICMKDMTWKNQALMEG